MPSPRNVNVSRSSRTLSGNLSVSVGQRIRQAREAAGISQAQLARVLGRAPATLSNWESGGRMPGLDDLLELGEALDRPPSFFMPRRPSVDEGSSPASLVLRAEASQLAGADLGPSVDAVMERAGAMSAPDRRFFAHTQEPAALAEELLSVSRTAEPPVPVNDLAAVCGARVIDDLEFSTDALSGFVLHQDDGPVIAANTKQPRGRRRFTVAHERGHLLLNHHADFHIDLVSSVASGEPPGFDWRHERAANSFAASLLMPAGMVRDDWLDGHQDAAWLATRRYKVSQEAMGIRLAVLGLR